MRSFLRSVGASFAVVALLTDPSYAAADNGTTPMQIRLAYAGATGMFISWNTFSQLPNPTVYYGLTSSNLNLTASSNDSVTYPTSLTYNNHVKITNLKPNTMYYYQPENSNLSSPLTFKTSRPAGDGTPYSIAVVVDLGLMGPQGLTTQVGQGAANPLGPHDNNTIQSLHQRHSDWDFLWHGKYSGADAILHVPLLIDTY
jgi:hypothetical protein